MPSFDVLDNINHADLKVKYEFGQEHGNAVNHTVVFATEFDALQREYPIYFKRDDNNKYYAVVLLGLDKDENLFLDHHNWNADYIPAVQMRGPFALEILKQDTASSEAADPIVRIDVSDSRVGIEHGQNLFLPMGGHAPYLKESIKNLQRIHVGAQINDDFFSKLESFGLIEAITVQADYGDSLKYTIPDMFTINKARLAELSGDELFELNQLGLLEHCFAVLSSSANMSRLVNMKLRTLSI